MDKISGIIPQSTRSTWVTGEIAKPRRADSLRPGENVGSGFNSFEPEVPFADIEESHSLINTNTGGNLDIRA